MAHQKIQNVRMFKRNLTSDAFDAISFDKKEIKSPAKINLPKKHEPMFRYGLITLCGLSLLVLLLLAILYFEYKHEIKSILRDQESQKIEINLLKKELNEFMLVKSHDEVIDDASLPVINYWGSIKAKGKTKALVELNGNRQLVVLGHLFDSGWRITELFDEYLIIESESGTSIQVNREEPA
jgi:hypothetical protein